MADLTKGLIGREDLKLKESGTALLTFTREDSTTRIITLEQLDAKHIQFRSIVKEIEDLIDGGYDVVLTPQSLTISGGVKMLSGAGTPEGSITAPIGSVYLRTDGAAGTSLYIKESGVGNTGWAAYSATSSALPLVGGTLTGPLDWNESGDEYLQIPRLTTVQRDALTPANGMLIYNTNDEEFQVYEDSAWEYLRDAVTLNALADTAFLKLTGGTLTGSLLWNESGDETIRIPRLTTGQRDLLTPADGMMIYNTTLNQFQFYENGAWVGLSPDSGSIKGWVNFNGIGVVAIIDSFNVDSVTDNGVGDYTITWDTDFASTDYVLTGATEEAARKGMVVVKAGGLVVGSAPIYTVNSNNAVLLDCDVVYVMAIGDQ